MKTVRIASASLTTHKRSWAILLRCALAGVAAILLSTEADGAVHPLSIEKQGYFYVGGEYRSTPNGTVRDGQMFVEYQIPSRRSHPYPIVFIHGQGQSGVNFLGTPDGREGWATYFLRQGYAVYVVDQPLRGRSPYHADLDGPLAPFTAEAVEEGFTAPERDSIWAGAKTHDQWPGSGVMGDPTFDQFYGSQLDSSFGDIRLDTLNRDDGLALLEKIGPAIILTHSRSGPFGWLIADARPDLVKGMVAVEPWGPPFKDAPPKPSSNIKRPYGLTIAPLDYGPLLKSSDALAPVQEDVNASGGESPCWIASGNNRRLPKLAKVPVLVVTGEASYHALYDHCTVQYLVRAGVHADWAELGKLGIHGNAHMMMLEKNNLKIASLIEGWVKKFDNKK